MNRLLKHAGASDLVASVGIALAAQVADEVSLLVVGPVEAVIPKEHAAVVLGQKIRLAPSQQVIVGETAVVFGRMGTEGVVLASEVRHRGPYVAGAIPVFLTGVVQRSD